jgi:hypothetical protein
MGKVGIPAEQRESVFATVAAVLHLGNISFVEGKEADSSKVAPGKAQEHLQAAGTAGVWWLVAACGLGVCACSRRGRGAAVYAKQMSCYKNHS